MINDITATDAVLMSLDLGVDFNMVDHSSLFHNLEFDVGPYGMVLKWFKYLLTKLYQNGQLSSIINPSATFETSPLFKLHVGTVSKVSSGLTSKCPYSHIMHSKFYHLPA